MKLAHLLACVWLGIAPGVIAAPSSDLPAASAAARADYRAGHAAIDRADWPAAATQFSALAADLKRTGEAGRDAALYWQAFAMQRNGADVGALVRALLDEYPASPWADDAQALLSSAEDSEREVAVDALLGSDPARAVPMLRQVLAGAHSDRVKKRALFVLMQLAPADAAQAIDALLDSSSSPALKRDAIQTLALAADANGDAVLRRHYHSHPELKRAVIDSALVSARGELIGQLVAQESDPDLQAHGIRVLGALGRPDLLLKRYPTLRDAAVQRSCIDALAMTGSVAALAEIAVGASAESMRIHAIRALAVAREDGAADALAQVYGAAQTDPIRRASIDALMLAGASETLSALYRSESHPEHQRALLQALKALGDDAALKAIDESLRPEPR